MLLPDWIELCASLNAHGADYLLVGGQAVIAHGYPRLTRDMDLWVRPSVANGIKVLEALSAFGVESPGLTADQFENPRTIVMLGREPYRIDLLTDLPGITFDEAWPSRIHVMLNQVRVPVIGKRELIKNKRTVGRLQDLADADALEKLEQP